MKPNAAAAVAFCALVTASAGGEPPPIGPSYRVELDSYQRFFQRAPLPAPAGALVVDETRAPFYEYALLDVRGIDVPWQPDGVDVELAAWGSVDPGDVGLGRRLDGDITTASVRQRFDAGYVTLGRQLRAGGAARLSRFDGVAAGLQAPFGLSLDAYGGFVVLPRWSERPGYQLLGSAADTLARDPAALEPPRRDERWLAGARAAWAAPQLVEAGLSFHEERREGEIGRRELGLDLRATPIDMVGVTAVGLLDVDSLRPSDARLVVDVTPLRELELTAETLHVTPALLLSRQSVLSVFSSDTLDELGGTAHIMPWPFLELRGGGYGQILEGGDTGLRTVAELRLTPAPSAGLELSLRHGVVNEPKNGYQMVRVALGVAPVRPLKLTAETYVYLYDEPIAEVPSSIVTAASAGWAFDDRFSLLAAASVARTPYAHLDAQGIVRFSVAIDGEAR